MKTLLIILAFVLTQGCAGRIMYVKYGVDPMTPEDRKIVYTVLKEFPDGQRWSWTLEATGHQYTMTPVNRYFIENDLMCRKFTIDDVWPIRSPNRRHKQTTHRACQDYNDGWVLRECEGLKECWFK